MPDTYTTVLTRARRLLPALAAGLRLRMARILTETLGDVFARYLASEITEDAARQMVADVERALGRYGVRASDEVRAAMLRAAAEAGAAHAEALERLLSAAGAEGPQVAATFSGVPVEALERLAAAREAGLTYKTLDRWNARHMAGAVNRALDRMVGQGESWQTAARRIMRSLAAGDPYLRAVAENYGPRGGLTRAARLAGVQYDREAAQVARRLGYDAARIARTESAAAFREADSLAALRSPVVAGLQLRLSPRHPVWDVCDVYATLDLYGLGAGVFPPGKVPVLPHPHCLCFLTPVLRPESEWGRPKPEASRPALRAVLEIRSPSSVTARARQRAVMQALRDVSEAYRETEPRETLRRAA